MSMQKYNDMDLITRIASWKASGIRKTVYAKLFGHSPTFINDGIRSLINLRGMSEDEVWDTVDTMVPVIRSFIDAPKDKQDEFVNMRSLQGNMGVSTFCRELDVDEQWYRSMATGYTFYTTMMDILPQDVKTAVINNGFDEVIRSCGLAVGRRKQKGIPVEKGEAKPAFVSAEQPVNVDASTDTSFTTTAACAIPEAANDENNMSDMNSDPEEHYKEEFAETDDICADEFGLNIHITKYSGNDSMSVNIAFPQNFTGYKEVLDTVLDHFWI